ncbi:MAG: hypothetical protein V4506_10115 [Bacteroidota bacterium]
MKQLVVIINLMILFFISSCATQKMATSNDDVYANPKEDRIEDARIAAAKKQAREAREKRYNDSIAAIAQAQKDKDDANPYYKDRDFKYDDYYDYEYATRVKRFNNNINGLGYYDNYYTNSYWYNKNPYNYGVSVYNGYSWWGSSYNNYSYNPSASFYTNYGWGNNNGYGGYNGYNPYDPYASSYWQGYNNGWGAGSYYGGGYGGGYNPYASGYNPYGYNPYGGYGYNYNPYGYGYNPYGYGYGYNPYGYGGGYGYSYPSNGWGYYNVYDNNSSYTYGPRSSHVGNNSPRTSNPGVRSDDYYQKYVSSATQQQAVMPKFTDIEPVRTNPIRTGGSYNSSGGIKNQPTYSTPVRNGSYNGNYDNSDPVRNTNDNGMTTTPVKQQYNNQDAAPVKQQNNNGGYQPVKQTDSQPVRQQQYESQPVKQQQQYETQPVRQQQQYESQPVRQNNDFQSMPSNNGGGGGGGGVRTGGGRPR